MCEEETLRGGSQVVRTEPYDKGLTYMASVSAKALDEPDGEVASGPYRVVSTTMRVQTRDRLDLHNLTEQVQDFVRSSGVRAGQVIVASMHTTSAIFINEWQDALLFDIKAHIENLISQGGYYRHNDPEWSDCDRNNADSHLRTLALGTHVSLPVVDGSVVLGEWQSVIMGELDGPRKRNVRLQVMGVGDE
jgi:secondary thiamine-phosphate synthase enzyme